MELQLFLAQSNFELQHRLRFSTSTRVSRIVVTPAAQVKSLYPKRRRILG